jgi:glycosyltransferase involved in cell wall biosynthesis
MPFIPRLESLGFSAMIYKGLKTVLIITDLVLYPICHGDRQRIIKLSDSLKDFNFNVILVVRKCKENLQNTFLLRKYCNDIIFIDGPFFKNGPPHDFDVHLYYNSIEELISKYNPIAVIVEYIWMAPCLDKVKNKAIKIIDTLDIMHLRQSMYTKKGLDPWVVCNMEEEQYLLKKADVIMAIQKNELAALKEIIPGKKVILVGHYPGTCRQSSVTRSSDNIIAFVGSDNPTNKYSISEYLCKSWPIIIKNCSDVELHIFGRLANNLPNMKQVKKIGFIENIEDAYINSKIVINPTLLGTGLKIKTAEALCYGKALITTSFGADGLEEGAGKAFIVEDDLKEFAIAVIKLLNDDFKRISIEKNAIDFAKTFFNKDKVFNELLDVLNSNYISK